MTAAAWVALGVGLVLAGLLALPRLRPARGGLTSPQWMLLLGAGGMAAGHGAGRPPGRTGNAGRSCSGPADLGGMLALHLRQLPLAHLGMVAGGLVVMPLMPRLRRGCRRQLCAQLGQNLLCSTWMVVGMAAGSLVFLQLAGWSGAVREPAAVPGRHGRRHGLGHGRERQPGAGADPAELRPAAIGPGRALNPAQRPPAAPMRPQGPAPRSYGLTHCDARLWRLQYPASRPNGRVPTARFFWLIDYQLGTAGHRRANRGRPRL